ncbi:unnamed protein product, partial [marine sediment metagenome]
EELQIENLDPASVGSQLYHRDFIDSMLKNPLVKNHNKRWGLDLLIALLGISSDKFNVAVKKIDGKYDISRRPHEKVKTQYDTYIEIISQIVGKEPEKLSWLYNK